MPNANDPFDIYPNPLPFASGDDVYPVTCSDSTDLPVAARALRVTTAGNVKVTMRNGNARTLAFLAGETRYGRFIRVWSTGTDHTSGIEAYT